MNALSNVSNLKDETKSLKMGEVWLKGRVVGYRKTPNGNAHYFLVVLPAIDLYSHPRTVEVICNKKAFAKDEEIDLVFNVNGYSRQVSYIQEGTGEKIQYRTADISLSMPNETE